MTAVALAVPGRTPQNTQVLDCLRHAIAADDVAQVRSITTPLLPLVGSDRLDLRTGARVLMAEAWALHSQAQQSRGIMQRIDLYIQAIDQLKRCADLTASWLTAEHVEATVNMAYMHYLVGRYERGRQIMAYAANLIQANPTAARIVLYMTTQRKICLLIKRIKQL